jgi:hypothetical protein
MVEFPDSCRRSRPDAYVNAKFLRRTGSQRVCRQSLRARTAGSGEGRLAFGPLVEVSPPIGDRLSPLLPVISSGISGRMVVNSTPGPKQIQPATGAGERDKHRDPCRCRAETAAALVNSANLSGTIIGPGRLVGQTEGAG